MKIIHTEASLGWGGQEIRILSEASGMMELGHKIEIWASAKSNILHEANAMQLNTKAISIEKKTIGNVIKIMEMIKRSSPDIINTHSSTDTWLVAIANTMIKKPPPLIRTRHISAHVPRNIASRWLYTHATRHIVTTGSTIKQQLTKENHFPAEMITSIPTGINTILFHPGSSTVARKTLGIPVNNKYIGIIATLRSWKGHLYLLEAFAKLNIQKWHLLIVGDGPMRDALENKAQQLNLKGRILFVGQQKNPEEWFRALDIFCLPSYANEGVPQAILQAMLTELPIITTPVGAILDAVSNNQSAVIVPEKNVNSIVEGFLKIINDTDFAKRIGKNARQIAISKFSREKMIRNMDQIFSTIHTH